MYNVHVVQMHVLRINIEPCVKYAVILACLDRSVCAQTYFYKPTHVCLHEH